VVNGKDYPPPQPGKAFEPGDWRMEVRPGGARHSDVFLHVLCASSVDMEDSLDVRLLEEGDTLGAHVAYGDRTYRVMFDTTGEPAGRIAVWEGEQQVMDRSFTQTVQPQRYP